MGFKEIKIHFKHKTCYNFLKKQIYWLTNLREARKDFTSCVHKNILTVQLKSEKYYSRPLCISLTG